MGFERDADFYIGNNFLFPPLYQTALQYLKDVPANETIVELGCGCGYLAEFLTDKPYIGIDISNIVLDKARKRAGDMTFILADLRDKKNFEIYKEFHCFVCLEMLEHINADRDVVASIPSNSKVVFSVPDFDSKAHVRWFKDPKEVMDRYGEWLSFEDVTVLLKPGDKRLFVFNARSL